jgi:hypothetical protein
MKQFLKERIEALIWGAILSLLGWLLLPFAKETIHALSTTILATLSPKALLGLSFALCLVVLVLGALLFDAHSRERLFRKFEADPEFQGLMRHKKKHTEKVCPRCLADGCYTPIYPTDPHMISCQRTGCGFMVHR